MENITKLLSGTTLPRASLNIWYIALSSGPLPSNAHAAKGLHILYRLIYEKHNKI